MRAAGWTVTGVGAAIGLVVMAYALAVAEHTDADGTSALGDQVRMLLVGAAIVVIGLGVGAGLRRGHRWSTYVFMVLGALAGLAALWWAAGILLG